MNVSNKYERMGSKELLTARQAADLTGMASENTFRHWARQGRVPAVLTPSGRWLFRRSDIEALLEPRKVVTSEEQGPVDEPLPGLGETR